MLRELRGSIATTGGRRRRRRSRLVVTVTIVTLVFLLLLVIAALVYVWYRGNHTEVSTKTIETTLTNQQKAPPVVDEKTPVGVAVSVFSSPIKAGANASITIRTKQKAACNISLMYGKDKATDSGLVPKTADEYGVVGWSWTVESTRFPGIYPIDITCAKDGKSGYHQVDLIVEK